MKFSYEDHGSTSVLTVSGELTADQVDAFRRACQDRIENGVSHVVLDIEHLNMIDSAGLELLLWLIDALADKGGHLRIVKPDITVRTILEVTRLDRRFDAHESIESAAKSIRAL